MHSIDIPEIKIGNKKIGSQHKPFIIGEMSGNHNQSLDCALELVDIAADAGCDALKIQTYTADSLTIDSDRAEFTISDPKSLWAGKSLYKLYEQAATPYEWHAAIFKRCKERGILGFSTPFDLSAVDFLEELNIPFYKIASFENAHLPLIKKVAATKKPLIISTGMATLVELQEMVECFRANGGRDLVLLKCTSSYPASPLDSNLLTIPHMKSLFNVQVGLSDHTMGIGAAVASVALGATVIEKHFTTLRSNGGVDSAFSLEPQELKLLVIESERAWQALGSIQYTPTENEKKSLVFRRSIYVVEDIALGEKFTEKNTRIIRPGLGLQPKFFEQILGKTAKKNLSRGHPLNWDDLL